MSVVNLANLSAVEFAKIETDLANCRTLGQVLTWASTKPKGDFLPQIVAETIAQDEYTIDIIIPYKELFWCMIQLDSVRLRQLPSGNINRLRMRFWNIVWKMVGNQRLRLCKMAMRFWDMQFV